jgi:transcriptional regulator with XRE-family HTH domain
MNKKEKAPLHARALLATNVQTLRIEAGVTQEKLAEMGGLHRTYVSHVERQLANVTIDNVQKLADVLGVPVGRLLEPLKRD